MKEYVNRCAKFECKGKVIMKPITEKHFRGTCPKCKTWQSERK